MVKFQLKILEFSATLIKKKSLKLKPYSGYQIPSKGVVTIPCEHKGNIYNFDYQVIEIEAPAVLSAQTCKEMGLLLRIHQPQESQLKNNSEFQSLFRAWPNISALDINALI